MASKQQFLPLVVFVLAAFLAYEITVHFLPQIIDNIENKAGKSGAVSGKTLPDAFFFEGKDKKITLADFRGSVVLVNLWATWCMPCVAELPSLDRLQKQLGGKGLKVVAINLDRDARPSTVAAFFRKRKVNNLKAYWDKGRDIPDKWTYEGIPTSFLLDRDGTIAEVFKGPYQWDKGDAYEKVSALVE